MIFVRSCAGAEEAAEYIGCSYYHREIGTARELQVDPTPSVARFALCAGHRIGLEDKMRRMMATRRCKCRGFDVSDCIKER
jgi:hypothetical protein